MNINPSKPIKLIMPKRSLLLAIALAMSLMLISGELRNVPPTEADDIVCLPDWYDSTDPQVLNYCGDLKARQSEQERQRQIQEKLQEPYVQTIPGSNPTVLLPQPNESKIIRPITLSRNESDPESRQGGGPYIFQNANSAWQAGSVPNTNYLSWDPLYIVASPGNGAEYHNTEGVWINNNNPTISTFVMNGDDSQSNYVLTFTSPKPVVSFTITNISRGTTLGIKASPPKFEGLNYIIYFDTGIGTSGTFDMARLLWTFSDEANPIPIDPNECPISSCPCIPPSDPTCG